ncbi:MAG: methylated-DNA--[protein]-cysteine S-methyltransferase [Candidatus Eisenbacteria bacterium]|nr:methylated-DNA--[protein]-cysteine S-methyltransferase [Candidatus Eisenbacteria bacterium]
MADEQRRGSRKRSRTERDVPIVTERGGGDAGKALLRYATFETDLGTFLVIRSEAGLRHVVFSQDLDPREELGGIASGQSRLVVEDRIGLRFVADAIRAYLAGDPTEFSLQLDLDGLSPFSRDVLQATRSIPYGSLRTYKSIAQAIGAPRAMQAVGQALSKNRLPIVIPCHRVVQSDGELGGYSCGGPDMKRRLIAIETGQYDLGLGADPSTTRRRIRFLLDDTGDTGD